MSALTVMVNDDELLSLAEKLDEGKKGAKSQFIDGLANHIADNFRIVTTPQWEIYCYENGVYVECENALKQLIEEYGSAYDVSHHISTRLVNEVIEKVKRLTYRSPAQLEESRWYLALENGLLDIRKWVNTGELRLEEFNPGIFKTARINAELREAPEGMNENNWFDYGSKLCPAIHNAFISWVGKENARLLYEIVGYCLYPDYPIHVAFMLVGEGSNGKSTFINLLRTFLGRGNYASVPLQQLTTNRFLIGELYGKLANLFPDLPKAPLVNTGIFKALTGQDEIYADVKHKRGFSFVNYAKMIFSANELPEVSDNTFAFWRRWIVIEFPNKFDGDPNFIRTLTTPDELAGLLLMALHALRALLKRGKFSISDNFKEMWLRRANSVYGFMQDAVEFCEDLRNCYTPKDELYARYSDWCGDNGIVAVSQTKFTQEFKRLAGSKARLGYIRLNGRLTRVWYGVTLKYGEEGEEPAGGLADYLKLGESETKQEEQQLTQATLTDSKESDAKEGIPESEQTEKEEKPSQPSKDIISFVGKLILNGCIDEESIKEKAKENGFDEDAVVETLGKLISLGLIDELEDNGRTKYCPR